MSFARFAGVFLTAVWLPALPAFAQDVTGGAALFKARCSICHSVTAGQKGVMAPNLSSVAGRKAGSTEFAYSPALKSSGIKWDKATLDKFLTAPMKVVPGTRMVISLPDAKQRADVVAYLSTLK